MFYSLSAFRLRFISVALLFSSCNSWHAWCLAVSVTEGLLLAVDIAPNYRPMQENHHKQQGRDSSSLSLSSSWVPYICKRPGDIIISSVDLLTAMGEGICVLASRGCERLLWAWPPLGWRHWWLAQGQSTASCLSQHSQHIDTLSWALGK